MFSTADFDFEKEFQDGLIINVVLLNKNDEKVVLDRIQNIKDKRIIYVVICAMGKAITRLEQFASENGFNVFVECSVRFDKALEDSELKCRKSEFKGLSESLGIYGQDIFGHKKTESLIAYYNNTPNNTLGIFNCIL